MSDDWDNWTVVTLEAECPDEEALALLTNDLMRACWARGAKVRELSPRPALRAVPDGPEEAA